MNEFVCATKIISGAGAVSKLGTLGAKRVLVVTDPYFQENGTAARVAAATGAGVFEVFHQIVPDPGLELAAAGTGRVRDFEPDLILALGGGSAMDCAKAMKFFSGTQAPLAAIPTTSGSGSEVTDFAILTHNGVKHPLVDRSLQPEYAILDSEFLGSMPRSLVADSGFDALSHALEALAATDRSPMTDALAKDAFCTVFRKLGASYAGDTTVRLEIHVAATMAGLAFNRAGLGLCHAMAHSLGGVFHLPHGRLNAMLLPLVIGVNAPAVGDRYGALARLAGLGGAVDTIAVRNLTNGLIRLRRELQMPENLAEAGIAPEQVRQHRQTLVDAVLADPCCATNPVKPTRATVEELLKQVTGHG